MPKTKAEPLTRRPTRPKNDPSAGDRRRNGPRPTMPGAQSIAVTSTADRPDGLNLLTLMREQDDGKVTDDELTDAVIEIVKDRDDAWRLVRPAIHNYIGRSRRRPTRRHLAEIGDEIGLEYTPGDGTSLYESAVKHLTREQLAHIADDRVRLPNGDQIPARKLTVEQWRATIDVDLTPRRDWCSRQIAVRECVVATLKHLKVDTIDQHLKRTKAPR